MLTQKRAVQQVPTLPQVSEQIPIVSVARLPIDPIVHQQIAPVVHLSEAQLLERQGALSVFRPQFLQYQRASNLDLIIQRNNQLLFEAEVSNVQGAHQTQIQRILQSSPLRPSVPMLLSVLENLQSANALGLFGPELGAL